MNTTSIRARLQSFGQNAISVPKIVYQSNGLNYFEKHDPRKYRDWLSNRDRAFILKIIFVAIPLARHRSTTFLIISHSCTVYQRGELMKTSSKSSMNLVKTQKMTCSTLTHNKNKKSVEFSFSTYSFDFDFTQIAVVSRLNDYHDERQITPPSLIV